MICAACATDAGWITDLWNDVISNTLATFTTTLKTQAEVADMIAQRPVLVLPDAGGFATYGTFRPGPGYSQTVEHSVFLAPHARHEGHGRAVMQALFDVAQSQEIHVMVGAISGANTGAVGFHTALGFDKVAVMPQVGRKNGHWLDLIMMQKILNPHHNATTLHGDPL